MFVLDDAHVPVLVPVNDPYKSSQQSSTVTNIADHEYLTSSAQGSGPIQSWKHIRLSQSIHHSGEVVAGMYDGLVTSASNNLGCIECTVIGVAVVTDSASAVASVASLVTSWLVN